VRCDARGADSGTLGAEHSKNSKKASSPDVMKVFAKAQENMMQLNQSRLKALDDLQVARSTIADLKEQLQEANAEIQQLKSAAAAAPVSMPAVSQSQPTSQEAAPASPPSDLQKEPSIAEPTASDPPAEPVATDYITIYYKTGWRRAFIHCSVDGKGWTQVPGMRMGDDGDCKKIILQGKAMEFVVNNGGDNWDKLDPYNESGPKNYSITSPGVYYLASGTLKKTGQ